MIKLMKAVKLSWKQIIVSLVVAGLGLELITEPDLGWHLMTGKYIVENKTVPRTDLFSYSAPDHPYIAHSWGWDVLMYLVNSNFGLWGVNGLYALIVVGIFWFWVGIAENYLQDKEWKYLMIIAVPYLVAVVGLRSLMVSVLGLMGTYYYLQLQAKSNRQGAFWVWIKKTGLWRLVVIYWMWANGHGGFVMGLGLVSLWLVIEAVFKKKAPEKNWLYLVGLLLGITLINPYGWKVYQFAFDLVTSSSAGTMNADWVPLLSPRLPSETWSLRFSLVLFAVAVIVGLEKRKKEKVLVGLLLGLTLTKIRFAVMLLAVMAPLVLALIEEVVGKQVAITQKKQVGWLALGLGLLLVGVNYKEMARLVCGNNSRACYGKEAGYPFGAVEYLKEKQWVKRVFNYYTWGGYLIWQMPDKKYFIDGRMDNFLVEGRSLLAEFGEVERMVDGWDEKKFWDKTEAVLVPVDWQMAEKLAQERGWQIGYKDTIAVVVEKVND